jgi:hypothetical protein
MEALRQLVPAQVPELARALVPVLERAPAWVLVPELARALVPVPVWRNR